MSIKNKKPILEAIDQLRGRKARPDLERICNHVYRKYGVVPRETKIDLEKLIDHEYVIRVEYKGSISYRNAAKWPRYYVCKSRPDAAASLVLLSASEKTRRVLHSALVTLINLHEEYRTTGIPYDEIQSYLLRSDQELHRFQDSEYLDAVIALEMNHANVDMLENGNFIPGLNAVKYEDEETIKLTDLSKQIIKPSMLDEIKKDFGIPKGATLSDAVNLSAKNRKIFSVLSLCKILRDAESKKINKTKKDKLKAKAKNDKNAKATTPIDEIVEGASPSTGGKTPTTASRVGSRPKRARQVFDPSDNNLPRSRLNKKARTTLNGPPPKQLQQHALQHQLLRMRHQNSLAKPEKVENETKKAHKSPATKINKSPKPTRSPSPASSAASSSSVSDSSTSCCLICKDDLAIKSLRLVNCNTCENKVHALCLKGLDDQTIQPLLKTSVKWQCMQCRACTICGKGLENKADWLVVCFTCNDSFHAACHAPALLNKPSVKWMCYRCTVEKAVSVGENMVTYGDKFPSASVPVMHAPTPILDGDTHLLPECNGIDSDALADVIKWTCEEVVDYFNSRGFQEEAEILKHQDVDGKTLLLMKRNDVLRGLGLKLGPALKIYCHVARMQLNHFGQIPVAAAS